MAKQGDGSPRRLVFYVPSLRGRKLKTCPCSSPLRRLFIPGRRRHNDAASGFEISVLTVREAWRDRQGIMTGSSEFTTWVALAGAAILAGLCAIYSSFPWMLVAAALVGAALGYKGEQIGRAYVERYLAQRRSR
jgi:hypothetical protein